MKMRYKLLSLLAVLFTLNIVNAQSWRSSLYPENWTPGYADSEGRFIHDFSYAGYHSGLKPIPSIKKNIIDVTRKPYFADNTGKSDVTAVVQRAIDDAQKAGGGVIYFPKGEYAVSVPADRKFGIRITGNNIILRGAGAGVSMLKNVSNVMTDKSLIWFLSETGSWHRPLANKLTKLSRDIMKPTTTIPVENADLFTVGDLVVIATDCTADFIREHKSEGMWRTSMTGVRFCRYVTAVDKVAKTIEIDAPTRYFMKLRDNARVYAIGDQISESAIENISIGNIQSDIVDGWAEEDYTISGTGASVAHASYLIRMDNALNCWIRNVATYRPAENKDDFHTLSNGIVLKGCRHVTIEKCDFQRSQYEGGGGNGYMYRIESNDCLIDRCHAEHSRHNYDLSHFHSNGNVFYKCTSKDPRYSSDYHMWLSMANLFDSFESDGDYLDARFRPWGGANSIHSYSTTQSVYWNTKGIKAHRIGYLIESRQFGWGYVIGTSGVCNTVQTAPIEGVHEGYAFDTAPADFVEGVGMGETLLPQSLYMDQLAKRKARMKIK